MTTYLVSWLFVALFAGAACYFLDRHLGAPLCHWFYNMTHREPLPAERAGGFIYNRPAKARFAVAVVLSAFQSVLAVLQAHVNPAMQLISFFLDVPLIMIGFYFGPWLDRFWQDKDRILDTVDQIESGQTSLGKELKGVSHRAAGAMREAFGLEEEQAAAGAAAEAPPAAPGTAIAPPEPEPDPRQLMDQYLRKE